MSCSFPNAISSAPSPCWSGSRRRWSKVRAQPASPRCWRDPSGFKGKKVATLAVRRQYRHASARQRPGPRSRPPGPHRPASRRSARPARRARGDHRQGLRSWRQRHRDQPQPHLHAAASEGHDDRGRMRGAGRRRRSTTSWPGLEAAGIPRRAGVAGLSLFDRRLACPLPVRCASVEIDGSEPFSSALTSRIKSCVTI